MNRIIKKQLSSLFIILYTFFKKNKDDQSKNSILDTIIHWYNHSLIQSFFDSFESIRIAIQTQNWLIISTIHYQVFIIIILNILMLFTDTNYHWLKHLLSKYLSNNLITWFFCIQKHLRAFLMLNHKLVDGIEVNDVVISFFVIN